MKKLISFFIIPFIFFSCSPTAKKQIDIPQITIDIDKAEPFIFSSFFDNVQYVALSDTFLIGDIERVKVYNSRLIMLSNKSVLVFDTSTGKMVLRLRNIGKGPGEYVSLYDMLIDETNNAIELLDMNGQKVLRYDMEGNFIEEFKTSFFSFSFYKISNADYLFYNNNMASDITDHKLIKYNSDKQKIIGHFFPIDKHLAEYFFVVDANNFSFNPLSLYFCPSDTIYGFSETYVPQPQYTVNFASHQTPAGFYKEKYSDIADFSTKAVRNSYIYHVTNFVENNKVCIFSFRNDQERYWALHDKMKKTTFQGGSWVDDFHFDKKLTIEYENEPLAVDDKNMYFFLQPVQLIELMKSSKLSDSSEQSKKLLELYRSPGFSEQSNPILVVCKFKE